MSVGFTVFPALLVGTSQLQNPEGPQRFPLCPSDFRSTPRDQLGFQYLPLHLWGAKVMFLCQWERQSFLRYPLGFRC